MSVDLHTHTVHSDGTYTVRELLEAAAREGLYAVAITDHDTVAAFPAAREIARETGINLIAGVELSIDIELPGTAHMHILGLFIDEHNNGLRETLEWLRQARQERIVRILNKLEKLGMPIEERELDAVMPGESPGRPHVARMMVDKGYAASMAEAFERWIKKGAPAHVEKAKLTAARAIETIRAAGGLSFLAHPVSLEMNGRDLQRAVGELQDMGLGGIEVWSSFHTPPFSAMLREMTESRSMLMTGGSDFHGGNKSGIRLGHGRGGLEVPDEIYDQLINEIQKNQGDQS